MTNQRPPSWKPLSSILISLNDVAHPLFLALRGLGEEAIANAVRSGEVPVRARRPSHAFDRIEKRLSPEADIQVILNRIILHRGGWGEEFVDAAADQPCLEEWLRENAIPAAFLIEEEKPTGVEAECRDWLTSQPESPPMIKDGAFRKFNSTRPKHDQISKRAFNRCWAWSARDSWRKPGRRKD
jgi:hypothetical protein